MVDSTALINLGDPCKRAFTSRHNVPDRHNGHLFVTDRLGFPTNEHEFLDHVLREAEGLQCSSGLEEDILEYTFDSVRRLLGEHVGKCFWAGCRRRKIYVEFLLRNLRVRDCLTAMRLDTELNDLYCSPNIVGVIKSRRMRWAGHVACVGERRGVHRVLVGKPEGKRPLGRPRHRWEDNIKMDLQEVGCEGMDWISLAQDGDSWRALVTVVMKLWVP